MAILLVCPLGGARGENLLLTNAKVVWTQGNRAYIASTDSLPIQPGSQLTFRYRRRLVATGEVEAIYEDELIAAVITGSLQKVKHLEQIEISALPFQPPSLIRIGYPAAGRRSPLLDCTRLEPDSTALGSAYRPEPTGGPSFRFVRTPSPPVVATWPDTLLVRFFEEVTDEEIALERGDIDVAVFWPGEASTHIRDAMGWTGPPNGRRLGLCLTATPHRPDGLGSGMFFREENHALDQMNLEVFRGDLAMLSLSEVSASELLPRARFEVISEIPGKESIERSLRNAMASGLGDGGGGTIQLELQAISEGELNRRRLTDGRLIALGCPAISSPRFRKYVSRLDANVLVNLFVCTPAGARQ